MLAEVAFIDEEGASGDAATGDVHVLDEPVPVEAFFVSVHHMLLGEVPSHSGDLRCLSGLAEYGPTIYWTAPPGKGGGPCAADFPLAGGESRGMP